jgi:hypothetical protein
MKASNLDNPPLLSVITGGATAARSFHRAIEADHLMRLPAMPASDFFGVVLGLPDSTAEEIIDVGDGPEMFLLGRRRYIRTVDALAWLDERAQSAPYVKRRNIKRRQLPGGAE